MRGNQETTLPPRPAGKTRQEPARSCCLRTQQCAKDRTPYPHRPVPAGAPAYWGRPGKRGTGRDSLIFHPWAAPPDHIRVRSGCWTPRSRLRREKDAWLLLRKEVIQPHLPVRLPCYDLVPIAGPTFDGSPPCGLGHRLRVLPTFVT